MNTLISRRVLYISLAMLTIVCGLLVHLHGSGISTGARDKLGDALWAAMILWLVSAAASHARLITRVATAYTICAAVELSQLYHAHWIDVIRATAVGHLLLGSGFDRGDLNAYALGVVCAALLDKVLVRSPA